MKVGWIEPHLKCCGGIRRVLEISNRLQEMDHNQVIFLPKEQMSKSGAAIWLPVLAELRPLEHIENIDLDVIIFNLESQWPLILKSPAKVKVNYILHYAPLYKDANEARDSYNIDCKKIANSNWTADMIFAELGERPIVVHGGINPEHFHPVKCEIAYDVLCYGSNKVWKGTKTIEKAVKLLYCSMAQYEGKGIPQASMAEIYSKAKVFVSGSYYEGWNHPALEAMACGVPVVMTDDGGSSDYAVNNQNALIVSPRDHVQMALAIADILAEKTDITSLIKNGLKTAKKFTWEKTVDKLLGLFETWLKEK